jgi:cytochrome P450
MQDSSFTMILAVGLTPLLGWIFIRHWYFRIVTHSQTKVRQKDGRIVPLQAPKLLVGNLVEVYQSDNRLAAYHRFNEQFGEIVQIFWMWRQQISVTNIHMAQHILVTNQKNYQKFPPNQIVRQLYGSSVLTDHGSEWQRQRTLIQTIFSPQRVAGFHDIFVACSEQLASQWCTQIEVTGGSLRRDVYPDLIALFLDIIGQAALGINFGVLSVGGDELVTSIRFILKQSTHPLYQFTSWWQRLPLPINRQLTSAFTTVDQFLYGLIRQRRATIQQGASYSDNLLDSLLQSTESIEGDLPPFTDKEVRDNLLAIILNGYETVATSVALTLDLLARHPEHLIRVQAEVDQVFAEGSFTSSSLRQLPYLRAVIVESLRLCPPMAGLQRISIQSDVLSGWSIPAEQVVGIPLRPLHLNASHYGEQPEQFRPQRYLASGQAKTESAGRGCPLQGFLKSSANQHQLPLTFGDGARRCLGETFALQEMTVALSILLHRFTFVVKPGDEAVMELGKFGLFISMLPKEGVNLTIGDRRKASQENNLAAIPEQ